MKNINRLLALTSAALFLAACGGAPSNSAPAANAPAAANPAPAAGALSVKSVTFFTDDGKGHPGAVVTSFVTTDNPLYAKVELNRLETAAKFKVVWVAVAADNGKDVTIVEKNLDALVANIIDTNVKLPRDWPVGNYRLDIYSGNNLLKAEPFTIAAK